MHVFLPVPLIFLQESAYGDGSTKDLNCTTGYEDPYLIIMTILASTHFIFGAALGRIYILIPEHQKAAAEDADFTNISAI